MIQVATRVQGAQGEGQDRVGTVSKEGAVVIALADGAGYGGSAARAAQTVVSGALESPLTSDPMAWMGLLTNLDGRLAKDRTLGETTAIVSVITDAGIVGASVGDSGVWAVLQDRTLDLTESQVRKPLIGSGKASLYPFGSGPVTGTLVYGSDGLFKYASMEKICELARGKDLEESAQALIDLVRLPSGSFQDDVSVVLARWG